MSKKKIICLSPNKTPPVRSRANRYAWLLASVAAFALNIPAYANPEDGVVSAGSATITTTVKNVDIHQSSNRAIIDWRSFDIAPDETTRFHQPGASATTLNRVNSANPSTVAGNLQANGNVILINPNGVFFSKTAHVDVNGLVATTANIDNSEFMAGSTTFNRPGNPDAAIVNEGRITAREAGLVGLVAPRVENSGTISARLGRVALSSGDTATVDLYGDGLVSVAVSDDVQHQLVRNSGTIAAEGGTVQISAAAGRQIVDSLIDVSGAIDTPTVATRRGRILIQADSNKTESTALVSGSLNAAGRHAGEKGGQIDVLADNVGILSGATLDASGQTGGGTVHVGGDYQGQGTLQRAQRSIVQAGSVIDVSAGEEGDGGRAIVWADQWTVFAGQILARGGRNSGNGGFVETSGKNILTATGIVDAAAPFGVAGLWLLDPNNITIQTTGSNTNITGNPDFTTSNNSAILTVGSIQTALNAGTSVSVTTASAGTNTQLGDITVANSITKSSGGNASLTLTANRSIILNTGVSISSTSGQMGVTLNADSDANGTGSITLNSASSILSNGGDIVLGGGANPLTTAARGYAGSVIGINLTAATLNAAGGNISLRGTGHAGTTNNYGILMQTGAKVMTSGAGTITMNGTGGVGTTGNRGIYLTGTGSAISSVDGAITLTGQGGGTTTTNEGIYLAAAATIAATGSGALTLTGHAGGTTVQGVYLNQTTAANTLMSAGGTVTLKSNQTIQLSKAHIASPTAQAEVKPDHPAEQGPYRLAHRTGFQHRPQRRSGRQQQRTHRPHHQQPALLPVATSRWVAALIP
jgi:filamentous hemagglutinin family protein